MADALYLAELDDLERDPEADGGRIGDLMEAVATDIVGLRVLVGRYAASQHPLVPGHVVLELNRAAWDWEPPEPTLCDLVLDFIDIAGRGTHPSMLATTCNALMGLETNGILRITQPDCQERLAEFLLWCLDQNHFLPASACIDLIHDLRFQGILEFVLPSAAIEALKKRLADLAAEDREEFREDLAALRAFWSAS